MKRASSAADRRRVELTLSARGRRAAAGVPDLAQARLIDAISGMTTARRRQLASTLGEVARALAGHDRAPSMFFEERRGELVPRSQSQLTLSPILGLMLPERARLLLQYDFIRDELARDAVGVPTDADNDQLTVRLQVDL